MIAIAGHTGRAALQAIQASLQVCLLMVNTFVWTVVAPLRGRGFRTRYAVQQFVEYGVNSLPIVTLICFLIGAIMAMQSSYQLSRFGAVHLVANLVGVSAMRELAILMTAIIIAGRSGSAITAEIGTMKVSEEIDALEVMGLNVNKFLIAPKFAAMVLAVPMVTIIAVLMMIAGGYTISVFVLGLDAMRYIEQTADALTAKDLVIGMTKSVFFAVVICWVGVYRGFQVAGGAESVGRQTTSSVVTSIFVIIVLDMIFTVFFYFAF